VTRGKSGAEGGLPFVLFDDDRFEVFGFKNLAAIETFDVVYAIAASDDLGAVVVTGGLHKNSTLLRIILTGSKSLSSPRMGVPF
jgi:hypothetical protein